MGCDKLMSPQPATLKVVSIRLQPLLLARWKTALQSGDQKDARDTNSSNYTVVKMKLLQKICILCISFWLDDFLG